MPASYFERMKGDAGFFVREDAPAASERRGADAVGTRRVVDEGATSLARRDARSHFERASDRITSVDDRVGIVGGLRVDQLQRGKRDELQRFGQRRLRTEAADLCARITQDQQGALEIGVAVIFELIHSMPAAGLTRARAYWRVYSRAGQLSMESLHESSR